MDQLVKRRLVMPDEIKDLQPLHGILKILGFPAAPVQFKYIPYAKKAEALVPDPGFNLDLYLAELARLRSVLKDAPRPENPEVENKAEDGIEKPMNGVDLENVLMM